MQIVACSDIQPVVAYVAERLRRAVQAGPVLWLVSGGSTIPVAVEVQKLVGSPDNLTIMQIDERFGPPGHRDSNWQQLLDAGFSSMHALPMLTGSTLGETVQSYTGLLERELAHAATVIGLFGIGADGHTAGLLPYSSALREKQLVGAYQGPDYVRITITPPVFARITEAVAYAVGEAKQAALLDLQRELPVNAQPAQLLKQAHNAVVYTDIIEESHT